jgi:two-component system response regulator AtoC
MSRRCCILVVEDRDDVGFVIETALRRKGYEVELVETGVAAIDRLDLARFDLVVTDVTLPGGRDGLAVADAAARHGAAVILVSGNPVEFARAAGSGHAFLEKPFRVAQLQALAGRVMEEAGADCAVTPGASAVA